MRDLVFVAGAALSAEAAHVMQGVTVLTMLLSTYLAIFRFPSPIAVSAALRAGLAAYAGARQPRKRYSRRCSQ